MNKLMHNDTMTANALSLYAIAKGIDLITEQINPHNPMHQEYTSNPMIGERSLPIMLLANGACIATTPSIINYIEATRKTPRILSPDPSPNPEQVATIHLYISAIQHNLYRNITAETIDQWATMFKEFFHDIQAGRRYIAETGFSILDCFFFPATTLYITVAPNTPDKAIIASYRERVLDKTKYAHDPSHNLDQWPKYD